MPVAKTEVSKEIRAQRHDFIKEYYKMAVADLDRHLKGSWQTIVTVAATVASLSLAQEGKLPVPFAVSIALAVGFWGLLNLIDGNYWALRAIAFLANVEATYFSEQDRRYFNPYAGSHPPYKLLDSLKYQFLAVFVFCLLAVIYFLWRVLNNGYAVLADKIIRANHISLIFWAIPFLIVLAGVWYIIKIYADRVGDYLCFVTESPGPGIVKTTPVRRTVEFQTVGEGVAVRDGEQIQSQLRKSLEQKLLLWNRLRDWTGKIVLILFLAAALTVTSLR